MFEIKLFCCFIVFLLSAFSLNIRCAADAVFRSEGVTDLSATKLLISSPYQITVLKAPHPIQGELICRGAELSDFETIEKKELDSLVFVPFCEDVFCQIELISQGESHPLSITVTNRDFALSSYSADAAEYCWAWAKSEYFSHIRGITPNNIPAIPSHL